ncbi:MAG: Unknown protein [uncultured Sulfurovum sp.]|uniref:Thioredoxin domain-containing protein n=1 Tax=uncultured Sulfurovum sp. TaxID=269237 RepID=A0A6S6SNI8_9BACT|nr:MAG: Unknown protein [uncultured Sulfurovum sp.]
MNKRTFLLLVFLTSNSFVLADEYITNEYYEEAISYMDVNESFEIVETDIIEENSTMEDVTVEKEETKELSEYLVALKEAQKTGKVILLAIRATHCHYCDEMEKETLSEPSVKSALDADFITLHYNQDLESLPLALQEGMTPNFIFVDQDENIINQYPGMRSPKEFKEALAEILAK